ncbi:hypothetical protein QFK75_13185 [Halobacterium rubrum]|nr:MULTISPECIES: hypothetical protein [Halobacterium]MDH5021209.1 hypothetical protein [Halobacterium rubrum]
MSDEEWTWELSATARTDLDAFSPEKQERILDKLDEIVTSPRGATRQTTANHCKTAPTRKSELADSDSP